MSLSKNPQYYKVDDKRRRGGNGMVSYVANKLLLGIKIYEQALTPP
jgi:hypothetical protein